MSARSKLKRAIRAIEDAQDSLRRAKNYTHQPIEVSKANRELEDAISYIKKAMRDVD